MFSLLALSLCAVQEPAPPAAPAKVDLKVLYAGRNEGERADRFAAWLGEHFTQVGRADYSSYTAADAEGWDVVVLDCEIIPPEGRMAIGMASPPELDYDYDRATVVIGGAVSVFDRKLETKNDWL